LSRTILTEAHEGVPNAQAVLNPTRQVGVSLQSTLCAGVASGARHSFAKFKDATEQASPFRHFSVWWRLPTIADAVPFAIDKTESWPIGTAACDVCEWRTPGPNGFAGSMGAIAPNRRAPWVFVSGRGSMPRAHGYCPRRDRAVYQHSPERWREIGES